MIDQLSAVVNVTPAKKPSKPSRRSSPSGPGRRNDANKSTPVVGLRDEESSSRQITEGHRFIYVCAGHNNAICLDGVTPGLNTDEMTGSITTGVVRLFARHVLPVLMESWNLICFRRRIRDVTRPDNGQITLSQSLNQSAHQTRLFTNA